MGLFDFLKPKKKVIHSETINVFGNELVIRQYEDKTVKMEYNVDEEQQKKKYLEALERQKQTIHQNQKSEHFRALKELYYTYKSAIYNPLTEIEKIVIDFEKQIQNKHHPFDTDIFIEELPKMDDDIKHTTLYAFIKQHPNAFFGNFQDNKAFFVLILTDENLHRFFDELNKLKTERGKRGRKEKKIVELEFVKNYVETLKSGDKLSIEIDKRIQMLMK
ncbi:hypothetical protein CGC52_07345 [Capnocytophaga sp. H2931]|nr:hypothetical protein CGC52_07345 [Capnocytophaga sp. H2931]